MGGLLYKDFVALTRMKKTNLIWSILAITFVYIILRVIFRGSNEITDFMLLTENGSSINILDTFFVMGFVSVIILGFGCINQFIAAIVREDEKSKTSKLIMALPLNKNTYLASKYVFMGIVIYAIMSLEFVWSVFCSSFCLNGRIQDFSLAISSLIVPTAGLALLVAAIDLMMSLLIGIEKATLVKVGVLLVVALTLLGYLMFGDLRIIKRINIDALLEWFDDNSMVISVFSAFTPVIALGLYYLSYRITCMFYDKFEW